MTSEEKIGVKRDRATKIGKKKHSGRKPPERKVEPRSLVTFIGFYCRRWSDGATVLNTPSPLVGPLQRGHAGCADVLSYSQSALGTLGGKPRSLSEPPEACRRTTVQWWGRDRRPRAVCTHTLISCGVIVGCADVGWGSGSGCIMSCYVVTVHTNSTHAPHTAVRGHASCELLATARTLHQARAEQIILGASWRLDIAARTLPRACSGRARRMHPRSLSLLPAL